MTLTSPARELVSADSGDTAKAEPGGRTKPSTLVVADGPYVEVAPNGWLARYVSKDGAPKMSPLGGGERLQVPPADGVVGFDVGLRPPEETAPIAIWPLDDTVPVMVVADTHGEFGILVALLQSQGIIDGALGWSFGSGHVVVLGDVVDRGPFQVEILWLLYELEAKAMAAGGRLHFLLGNHEALMLRGDRRYLNDRYNRTSKILGFDSYDQLFSPQHVLGQWLRSRNTMLRLGDNLFVHGGLSPSLVEQAHTIEAINANVRDNLDSTMAPAAANDLSAARDGPLWYRGYFRRSARRTSDAEVSQSLEHFGAERVFVGHTPVDRAKQKYGGRVIAVHVYPERDAESGAPRLEAILRLNGRLLRVDACGHRRTLRILRRPGG